MHYRIRITNLDASFEQAHYEVINFSATFKFFGLVPYIIKVSLHTQLSPLRQYKQ
jgi:hypothetical protein